VIANEETLVGLQLGDNLITEKIASGVFSNVYKAIGTKNNFTSAIKVAKRQDLITTEYGTSPFSTRALSIFEGGTVSVRPIVNKLINAEYHLNGARSGLGFPNIHQRESVGAEIGYSMDFQPSRTLREVLQAGDGVSIDLFIKACHHLDLINRTSLFKYHGDLKPEHFLCISDTRVGFVDSGSFAELECVEGDELEVAVTTPLYYPFLTPDDLFAFGIMFYETVCKLHPLLGQDETTAKLGVEEDVERWVQSYRDVGQYFLEPILDLKRPAALRPEISASLEAVVLKGLRLSISSAGALQRATGFEDFAAWKQALITLKDEGLQVL
jgi:serine/threonine protein kinase